MPRRLPEKRKNRNVKFKDFKSFDRPIYYEGMVKPSPVSEGEEYDVTIDDLGREGDGVCNVKGFRVYVHGARVGQRARIRITSVRGDFATASFAEKSSSG
jgi:predicted RNA-binding protein with TRAM domain